ncbi:MAG: GtrA family protein [Dorea sp.]|jgi:putative flippase GtrA|nr:GtrA family protein [Dorea sp.]MDE6829729.1 GtrA family protein [Lachnospiraceae bacterium]
MKSYLEKYAEVLRYLVVGGLTTVVSLVIFYGCVFTVLDGRNAVQLQIANIISWIGAVAFAYVTNRIFVFKSTEDKVLREICSFVLSRVVTLLTDMGTMFLLATILRLDHNLSKLFSMVLVMVGNYVISKLFVFKKK